MPVPSLGLIFNPNALGVRRRRGLRDRLTAILGRAGTLLETRGPEELTAAVARFQRAGVGLIATCGGDGTNLATITEVVRAYGPERLPALALLRGGTVNTVAENLQIRGEPDAILARLLAWRARGEEPPQHGQDLLQVNGMYGFLFAAAMGARFLEAYYGGPRPGTAWAGVLAARTVASSLVQGSFARWLFAPVDARIEVDGAPVRLDGGGDGDGAGGAGDGAGDGAGVRLLVASTVPDVGIGMRVAWQAGRQPGRFHLVASRLSTTRMALQFHRVVLGQPLIGGPHLDRLAQRARIHFAAPQSFTLDGELFREREVEISVGPRLWVARP